MNENIIQSIYDKYTELGENPETYLKGLIQARPLSYWDYIEADTLLSLQKPRTSHKDEEIFIMYHQVTELLLKLLLHEVKQVVAEDKLNEAYLNIKLSRINRYTSMLINSFDIMRDGMDYDVYNTFRTALAPASGFQSVQFRYIELCCTRLENLVNEKGREQLPADPGLEDYFEYIYWKDAGLNRKTGEKTLTLRMFEEKYTEKLKALAIKMKGNTIEDKVLQMGAISDETREKLREFDRLYNIEWPLVHLNTARHYLDKKGENQAATGGSEWKKYLHPAFQQRKFFPQRWSENEKTEWGMDPQKEKSLFNPEQLIAEIVARDYRYASVFESAGIDFCCKGNRSLKEACSEKGIAVIELMDMLEKITSEANGSTHDFSSWPADLLADYIEKKHHRFVKATIPLLTAYLNKICAVHGSKHPELEEIRMIYDQAADELITHMDEEEKFLFPYVRELVEARDDKQSGTLKSFASIGGRLQSEHEAEGDYFRKIAELSGNYEPPADACGTYKTTYQMLKKFHEDLHLHIHLENNLLFRSIQQLEEKAALKGV